MAKLRATGADARLIGITEVTYGAAPADGYFVLPFKSTDLDKEIRCALGVCRSSGWIPESAARCGARRPEFARWVGPEGRGATQRREQLFGRQLTRLRSRDASSQASTRTGFAISEKLS